LLVRRWADLVSLALRGQRRRGPGRRYALCACQSERCDAAGFLRTTGHPTSLRHGRSWLEHDPPRIAMRVTTRD